MTRLAETVNSEKPSVDSMSQGLAVVTRTSSCPFHRDVVHGSYMELQVIAELDLCVSLGKFSG